MLRNGMIIVSLGLLFMFIEASATIAMLETGLAVALILASIIETERYLIQLKKSMNGKA